MAEKYFGAASLCVKFGNGTRIVNAVKARREFARLSAEEVTILANAKGLEFSTQDNYSLAELHKHLGAVSR